MRLEGLLLFPDMLRKDREVPNPLAVLAQADWCTVALNSPLGYPYQVAVNHVLIDNKLYFHCAEQGYKLDCIRHDPRVCVQAVTRSTVVPQDSTTDYLSVVAFGRARWVEDVEVRRRILLKLMERFAPQHPKAAACSSHGAETTGIVEVVLEHITGKENKAL